MKVSLTEYRTNEEVLQMVEAETEIIDTLSEVDRRDGWLHLETRLIIEDIRRTHPREECCGTPRTVFLGWLLKTEEATVGYEDLKMLTQDRSSCRQ